MTLVLGINLLALCFSFFVAGCLIGALFVRPVRKAIKEFVATHRRRNLALARVSCNPVLTPGAHPWNAEAVLNPAALYLGGRTHLLYRAIGKDGVSRLGYASSSDGVTFDERLPYPAYVSQHPSTVSPHARRYSPVLYPSGGSWGGCEDPRMVAIGGRVYVTFNSFDNWSLRVACISIAAEDFLAKHWHRWTPPHFLSQPDGRDKNWTIFPEKIRGQFAILHSIIGEESGHVRVEYADDIDTYRPEEHKFYSPDPQRFPNRNTAWHTHARSAGPPPLKTDKGWLVFYHAHDTHEPARYKLGAMLLDLEDPTVVLHRSPHPILEPDEWYENDGKPGIVYAAGAVIHDGTVYVYYGGADKVVCVAYAPLEAFLEALIGGERMQFAAEATQTN